MTDTALPLVLARQFAETLTTSVFVVDRQGNLLYYNESAGRVLGRNFDETGSLPASSWTRLFLPTDESGVPLLPDMLPLMITLEEWRPAHGSFWIRGIDNISRLIEVASFPITDGTGSHLGAIAVFWETK
jgi:PAS domain-containing protein